MNVKGFPGKHQSRLPADRLPLAAPKPSASQNFCEPTKTSCNVEMNKRRSRGQDEIDELEVIGLQMAINMSLQEQKRHARYIQRNDQVLKLGVDLSIQEFKNYCHLEEQRRDQMRVVEEAHRGFVGKLLGAEQEVFFSPSEITKLTSYQPDHQRGNLTSPPERPMISQELSGKGTEDVSTKSFSTSEPWMDTQDRIDGQRAGPNKWVINKRVERGNCKGSATSTCVSKSEHERLLNLWDKTRVSRNEKRCLHNTFNGVHLNTYTRSGYRRPTSSSSAASAPNGTPQIRKSGSVVTS